jgi:hypothetical protein
MFFFSDDVTFHQQPVRVVVELNFKFIAKNVVLLARGVYE